MSFGDILGQIMQQGLGQGSPTQSRMDNLSRNFGGGTGGNAGLDGLLGQLQGALSRAGIDTAGAQQSATGFADKARDFLKTDQVGGLSGAQVGGIGALAGALLGGGLGGAARGGAMAVLGTLALSALRNAQNRGQAGNPGAAGAGGEAGEIVDVAEVQSLASPDSEKLALRAMISAAKADGAVDKEEIGRVIGKLDTNAVSEEERAFVMAELQAPVDIEGLAAAARTPAQAAEIYAASLLAINVDTDQERSYLAELARALKLDREAVAHLHQMTGAPQAT